MGNVNFKKWEMPNINEGVRLSSPQVLLAGVETGSAIWDGNLVIHGEIKHILHDLSIQFLGMQLKRSMGDTCKDVQGSTDNHNGDGELVIIHVPTFGGVDRQDVV